VIKGKPEKKRQILFNIFDYDGDGVISSLDVLNFLDCGPEGSRFKQEVKIISDFYVAQSITRRINRRPPNFLHIEVFTAFLNSIEYKYAYEEIIG